MKNEDFFLLERTSAIPLYVQVKNRVLEGISNGEISPDGKLLSERSLSRHFKINRATARRALQDLANSVPLIQLRGKGTFLDRLPSKHSDIRLDSVRFIFPGTQETILTGSFFYRIWAGADSIARESGTDIIISAVDNNFPALNSLSEGDGLVAVSLLNQDFMRRLPQKKGRICLIDCDFPSALKFGCDEILVDSYNGACIATEYLLRMGHKNIAIITEENATPAFIDREKGYTDTINKYGRISKKTAPIAVGGSTRPIQFQQLIKMIIDSPNPPTAIFALGDWIALEVLRAAAAIGVKIPDHISVIGFGDTISATCSFPPLTSINVSEQEMGKAAIQKLWIRARNPLLPGERFIMPANLIERESVAYIG